MTHEIVVGNIGTVYSGNDRQKAEKTFETYSQASMFGSGRVSGETVTWMIDGKIYSEFEQ